MKKLFLYFLRSLAIVSALVASVFVSDEWYMKIHRETLVHGSDLDRLSLLLTDYVNGIGNLDWKFHNRINDGTRKLFGSVLTQLDFEKHCSKNGSEAVDGAMRCEVNGFSIDYIENSH